MPNTTELPNIPNSTGNTSVKLCNSIIVAVSWVMATTSTSIIASATISCPKKEKRRIGNCIKKRIKFTQIISFRLPSKFPLPPKNPPTRCTMKAPPNRLNACMMALVASGTVDGLSGGIGLKSVSDAVRIKFKMMELNIY